MLIVLPDELDILREMQPLDRDVFNYLAERCDFESGVVGRTCKVSYGGMAYDMTEHDGSRRVASSLQILNKDKVRNSVRRLISAGLLMSLSSKGADQDLVLLRVFWVDLLTADKSAQNPDAIQMPRSAALEFKKLALLFNGLGVENKSSYHANKNPDAITSFTQQQQQTGEKFSMALDWQPTSDEFEMMLFRAGKKSEDVKPEWVAEFVSYWFAEGRRLHSQREWTAKLAMRVVDCLRDPGRFERERGGMARLGSHGQADKSGTPEWARIPRDDEALTSWAVRNGYGEAEPWMTYLQYRGALRVKVEGRLKQWRQLS